MQWESKGLYDFLSKFKPFWIQINLKSGIKATSMMPYTLYFYLYSINCIGLCCSLIWSQKILDESWVWIIQMLSLIWSVIALYKAGFLAANCSRFFKTSIISSADGSLLCWFSWFKPSIILSADGSLICWFSWFWTEKMTFHVKKRGK